MTTRSKSGSGAGVDFQIEGKAATRAVVLHVDRRDRGAPPTSDRAVEARLEEAVGLALAIDLEVEAAIVAPVTAPKPATMLGSGKVAEIAEVVKETEAELVVVNAQLSPIQQRNLEKEWGAKVLDRTGLILEIFGRRASTREGTLETVLEIRAAGFDAAPHLSCIASSRAELKAQLEKYQAHGIRHIVALRGDLPSGVAMAGELRHANELVSFIRETTGDWFNIEVACYPEYHPQTRNAADEVKNFKRKIDAGANAAMTQYFYNADAYFRFVDECEAAGITIPIVPGIMPISNFSQLARFSDACGAEIPRWIRLKLASFGDDAESIRAFVFDLSGRPLASVATPYRTEFPNPSWAEQDPEDWWRCMGRTSSPSAHWASTPVAPPTAIDSRV